MPPELRLVPRFSNIFLEVWVGFCSIMLSFVVLWVGIIRLILINYGDEVDEVENLDDMLAWGI
jgi:hypothetical protein